MNLELLLKQISNINKKYEEIDKLTGRRFNIFNLLNIGEIDHSKIIAMLLNPKGMHGKGNKFIEMFFSTIKINDFSIDNVTIETEKFIGQISNDCTTGGRIDIALTNCKNQQIFIENKIDADDQKNQLLRYHNYNQKAHIIYLTLLGDEPSECSTGGEKFEYKKVSYKEHILEWLELCKKESVDNSLLRETLTQYITLIKQSTEQPRLQKKCIDTILNNEDRVFTVFAIYNSFDEIKLQILKEKFVPLISNLADKLGYEVNIVNQFNNSYIF